MNIRTMTPSEIDGLLAPLLSQHANAALKLDRARGALSKLDPNRRQDIQRIKAAELEERDAVAVLPGLLARIAPLEQEYRRIGWSRYYLVQNVGGHLHASRHCSTCRDTTFYTWMTGLSGMAAEAVVEQAGEDACTVCFPWAPVDQLRQPSRLTTPEREEAAAARAARAAKSEALKAKRAAARITNPDGSTMRIGPSNSRVETLTAAWFEATEARIDIARGHSSRPEWVEEARAKLEILTAALAFKLETDLESAAAEILRKSQAKAKRDGRGDCRW